MKVSHAVRILGGIQTASRISASRIRRDLHHAEIVNRKSTVASVSRYANVVAGLDEGAVGELERDVEGDIVEYALTSGGGDGERKGGGGGEHE